MSHADHQPLFPDNGQDSVRAAGPAAGAHVDGRAGKFLTTAEGVRLPDADHSLKAGERGPTLMEDFHLREKITHFDHERIPERVVHARGAAAHGTFRAYGNAADITCADFLATEGLDTPVFVRFSTVLGSRGSADTVRDVRGFATKFYTRAGNFDLVGNNMPVFFIQDAIKFPDIIHAGKPRPDREIAQAQTAHDTFWDFISLHTEATHHVMWAMSDRAIPRSFRTMEGFGVHTFRLVNAAGDTCLVKFHWKPMAGIHSLVWEEAQIAAGADPDYHRRDMADGIDAGAPLEWELGVQVMPDTEDQTFHGIDLLDPTKIVPEELCEVRRIGRMTLDRNPTNYFAETEQVAFHVGNLVPGIEVTDDPLVQGRLFSYLDTQLIRLGGPNFSQIPINSPVAPVNDNLRDGYHQMAVPPGRAPYLPNSIDGGLPRLADEGHGGYVHRPRTVHGPKVRESSAGFCPVGFDDHFTQAALFYRSMTDIEKRHIESAFTFELGRCFERSVRERMVGNLARIDSELCQKVASGLGLPTPDGEPAGQVQPSPALSQIVTEPGPIAGRVMGVVMGPGADLSGVATLRAAMTDRGAVLRTMAATGGDVGDTQESVPVDRIFAATRSIEYDAVLVADGIGDLHDPQLSILLAECLRHLKPLGGWGDGQAVLRAAGIDLDAPGIVTAAEPNAEFTEGLSALLGRHRVWDRQDWLDAHG